MTELERKGQDFLFKKLGFEQEDYEILRRIAGIEKDEGVKYLTLARSVFLRGDPTLEVSDFTFIVRLAKTLTEDQMVSLMQGHSLGPLGNYEAERSKGESLERINYRRTTGGSRYFFSVVNPPRNP